MCTLDSTKMQWNLPIVATLRGSYLNEAISTPGPYECKWYKHGNVPARSDIRPVISHGEGQCLSEAR